MSNALIAPADRPAGIIPTVAPAAPVPTRRSILRAARIGQPAPRPERSPFAGWRGQTPAELLPTIAARPA